MKKGTNVTLDIRVLPQNPPEKVAKEKPKPPLELPPSETPETTPGTWKLIAAGQLEGNTAAVGKLQISPDGKQLYSGTFGGNDFSKFWDLTIGSFMKSPLPGHGLFLSNQQFLFTSEQLQRYDLSNKKTIGSSRLESFCHSVAITPDQTIAVTGGFHDPFLYTYHLQTRQRIQKIDLGNVVWSIAIHPNGKTTWIGSENEILIVELSTGKVTDRIKGQTTGNVNLHFTKNGERLISAAHGFSGCWLWETATHRVIRKIGTGTGNMLGLSFLPGDQQIVSGSGSKSLRLWDVATGKQLAMISAETNRFMNLAVSPDGKYVYTGGGSQYVESNKKHEFNGDFK